MRNLLHVLVSLAMWCLFGYYWYVVLGREVGPETVRAMITLFLVILGGLLLTMVWIGHNLRLARKFEGRRQGFRNVEAAPLQRDTIGRTIDHPGLETLRAAACVDVTADQETKTYRVATAENTP